MGYTIGQISDETGLSIHTLRYYEKEGILPIVGRNESGIRIYSEDNLELLRFICCLKTTGMPITQIKKFADLILQGDATIEERIEMLNNQKKSIQEQVDQLNSYKDMLDKKVDYYRSK